MRLLFEEETLKLLAIRRLDGGVGEHNSTTVDAFIPNKDE